MRIRPASIRIRLYDQFLFLEYTLENDYDVLGIANANPPLSSAAFNTIMNDITVIAIWADDLINTNEIDTANFDTYFQNFAFAPLQYFWGNDPNGSNGVKVNNKGLLNPPESPDPTPTQTTLNGDWGVDEAVLFNSVPNAPTNLTVTNTTSTEVDLSWAEAPANETGFYVDRSTTSSGGFASIATLGTATAYSNTGLTSGTTYYYEIIAFNTHGNSPASAIVDATPGGTGLNAPTALTAFVDSVNTTSQIDLSWTSNSSNATGFDVDQSTDGTTFSQIAQVPLGGTNPQSYDVIGLADGEKFYYEVKAYNAQTTSGFSNIANAVTNLIAPSGLSASPSSASQIVLNWTDNDGGLAAGYNIDRSTDDLSFSQIATVGPGAVSYNNTGLIADTTYYYEVQAFNTPAGDSLFSNIASGTTPANEIGGVVNDDYFAANGSNWSTQWTFINDTTTHTSVSTPTISADTGVVTMTLVGGTGMAGNYTANLNTQTMEDSYQSVLINTNVLTPEGLVARDNITGDTYYDAYLNNATTINIDQVVAGTRTLIKHGNTTLATNTWYDLVFEVVTANATTTDVMAKIWAVGTAEPTTWLVSTTNTVTQLQGVSGYSGLTMQPTGTTANTFTVDNFEAVNITTTNASFFDNFQNSSTTGWSPLTASRWSVGNDNNSIRYYINTSSYTAGSNGTLGEYSLVSQSGYTNVGDFTVDLDAAAGSTTAGSNYAIVFGYQNSTNYYFMEFNSTSGSTALYKVVSGTASVVASASGTWITDTSFHQIKITRKGTSISVWYDGNSVLSASDATFVGGEIGIGALNDAAYFDNVVIG